MDDFRAFLHQQRKYEMARMNPAQYADVVAREMAEHVNAVQNWIIASGNYDRAAMLRAMEYFVGDYAYRGKVYRGTGELIFDGQPASYSKSRKVAEDFAEWRAGAFGTGYIVERKGDAMSLDLSKMLQAYATCKIDYCDESEVIVLNTPVKPSQITEVS